jgi:cytochrome P450
MESLRVIPPVPLTVRTTAREDYIDGVRIPMGTIVVVPVRNLILVLS